MKKRRISAFYIYIYLTLVFLTSSATADTHSHEHTAGMIKCGTPYIPALKNSALNSIATLSQRETGMESSAVSLPGHFRVHYDTTGHNAVSTLDEDSNNIPDYVDSTLVYLEYAWDLEIGELKYPEPVRDGSKGGGDEIDVYLTNMGNIYGQTYPEKLVNGTKSAITFMEIENDFTEGVFKSKGYEALKVTTAHEFFHVIQFSMYYNNALIWWMEQTAVWMEDRSWDDVNDYLAYLFLFFNESYNQTPLNSNTGDFKYGAAVWPQYLAKKFGDDIILDIWNKLSEDSSSDIASFDDVIPIGLEAAFGEFAVWNYFTGERGNTDFYSDSELFTTGITTDSSVQKSPAADTLSTKNMTSRYVELLFSGEWDEFDTLNVTVNPLNGGKFKNTLIFFNGPYDYAVNDIFEGGRDIRLSKDWNKAVLVSSCVKTTPGTYRYDFNTRILNVGIVDEQYAFSLKGNYPNPFNSLTAISFTLPNSGNVTIRAYDTLGRKAADIFDGTLDAGEKQILWKPSELSGGIYLVKMTSPWGTKVLKTMYLK
jgi:hypothetical protein